MINFFYETDFSISNEKEWKDWIKRCVVSHKKETGNINYIFCDDEYLLKINIEHLNHDYYTDVIGFDYSEEEKLSGDIFISVDRVKENAENLKINIKKELARVVIHGVLHFIGYRDKGEVDKQKMTEAENKYLAIFDKLND